MLLRLVEMDYFFFFKQVLSSWSLDIEAKRVVARKHFVQHCTQADNFGAKLPKNDLLNKWKQALLGCRTFFPLPHGFWGPVKRSTNRSYSKDSLWLVSRRAGIPEKEKEDRGSPLVVTGGNLWLAHMITSLGTSRDNWETFSRGTEINQVKRHCNLSIEH